MTSNNQSKVIVLLVVGTLAFCTVVYFWVLGACCLMGVEPTGKALEYLKDAGLVALGSLGTMLANIRTEHSQTGGRKAEDG
jgi:hypothetical protein